MKVLPGFLLVALAATGSTALGSTILFTYTEARVYTGNSGVGNTDEDWRFDDAAQASATYTAGPQDSQSAAGTPYYSSGDDYGAGTAFLSEFQVPSLKGQQSTGYAQTTIVFQASGTFHLEYTAYTTDAVRQPFGYTYEASLRNLITGVTIADFAWNYSRPSATGALDLSQNTGFFNLSAGNLYMLTLTNTHVSDRSGVITSNAFLIASIGDEGTPVPEPATLAALGLGFLALRRRKG